MKKWYDEEYEFEVEVTGFVKGDSTVNYCRSGEEIGDKYTCTYGCPVSSQGHGVCSKLMMILFPIMEGVRIFTKTKTLRATLNSQSLFIIY